MRRNLIVFEGIDGAGKATQVKLLAKQLRAEGKHVTVFASPRYDLPTGKLVRSALHGAFGDFVGLSPYFSALPYLVDFAAWRDEIQDALKKGVVICDRYVPSTVAYHSAKLTGKKAADFVRSIEDIAYRRLKLPKPSLIIYLHVPVAEAQKLTRTRKRKRDQHERDVSYQKRVAAMYAALCKRPHWKSVDCVEAGAMRLPEAIHEEIVKLTR